MHKKTELKEESIETKVTTHEMKLNLGNSMGNE